MKKILLPIIFLVNFSLFSQTDSEKDKIIQSNDVKSLTNLKLIIDKRNKKINQEINEFIKINNSISKSFKTETNFFKIKYIIDNKPVYISTENASEAIATRTNFLHNGGALGLNLEGQNMHIAIWDQGSALSSHQEFADDNVIPNSRVNTPDYSPSNSENFHATHVAGTIVAKGIVSNAKGMAPQATLTSYDWDFDDSEALNQASNNGLLISNHSYGVPVSVNGTQNAPTWMMGCYNTDAAIWDNVAYNAPYYLMVASAGNNGSDTYSGGLANNYDKLTTNKNSKNNLVVANANNPLINPDGSGQMLNLFINTSSSQGPSDDGRVKPDITGDGTNVLSTLDSNTSAYGSLTGTSMSSPNVAGSLLLLQQYYNQLYGNYMRASTLKGLVCHTADDNGSSPGPDPIFGWGLLNTKVAAETIQKSSNSQAIVQELVLNNNDIFSFQINVDSGTPLIATLCWTDPPGTPQDGQLNSSTPALVNDLDIRIIDDSNTTYFPWKLQLSNVAGLAVKGDNIVDNVERINIDTPQSGSYTVVISHKGNLTDNLQNYSLIVTGSNLSSSLSVEEVNNNDFVVWPNPATNKINFKFNKASKTEITMFDMLGRSVYNSSIDIQSSLNSGQIDTSNLERGVYLLKFIQGNNEVTKRIIIE